MSSSLSRWNKPERDANPFATSCSTKSHHARHRNRYWGKGLHCGHNRDKKPKPWKTLSTRRKSERRIFDLSFWGLDTTVTS